MQTDDSRRLFSPQQALVMKISVVSNSVTEHSLLQKYWANYTSQQPKDVQAISLIRCKPQHKTARQFAEEVAHRYRVMEESWKSKAKKLEDELLRLQQCQFLSRMPVLEKDVAGGGIAMPSTRSDGVCDVSLSNRHDTVVLEPQLGPEPVHQHLDDSNQRPVRGSVSTALHLHCRFLHKLCEVQHLPGVFESFADCRQDVNTAFQDTFMKVTKELCKAIENSPHSFPVRQEQFKPAIHALIGCFDFPTLGDFQETIAQQLWVLLELAVSKIQYNTCSYSMRKEQQHLLAWCASNLAIHLPPLTLDACTLLTTCISKAVQELGNDSEGGVLLVNYDSLDNTYYYCKALEDILTSTGSLLPEPACTDMSQQLATVSSSVADLFPQVSHYLWRLEALLVQDVCDMPRESSTAMPRKSSTAMPRESSIAMPNT